MIEVSLKSCDLLYLSVSIMENIGASKTLIIVPGINEYKERYYNMANYFYQNGFNILLYDMRGHGKSISKENELGVISDAGKLIDDLVIVYNYAKNRFGGKDIYVLGDSLGALVCFNALPQIKPVKTVLVSPIFSESAIATLKLLKFMLGILGKNGESSYMQSVLGFESKTVLFSSSVATNEFKSDAKCYYNYKNKSIYEIVRLEANVKKLEFELQNIFLVHGSLDSTLSEKGSLVNLEKYLRQKGANVTSKDYNAGHKVLFDLNHEVLWQDILAYFA